jgi:hypothetical protein
MLFHLLRKREGGIPISRGRTVRTVLPDATKGILKARLIKKKRTIFFFDEDFICYRGHWSVEFPIEWSRGGPAEEIEKDEQLLRAGEERRNEAYLSQVAWDAFFNEPRSEEEMKLAFKKLFYIDFNGRRINGLGLDYYFPHEETKVHKLSVRAENKATQYGRAWPTQAMSDHGTALEKEEDEKLRREGEARWGRSDDALKAWLEYRAWHYQVKRDLKSMSF